MNTDKTMVTKGFGGNNFPILNKGNQVARCEGEIGVPNRGPRFGKEHVWDQLKRQMPSCHSVHDLELAVQDLWAHMPQDNMRCLINSMPDRATACIAAGGSSKRY
ncbi:transposable element Tcb2 transposase [Trichonephila clavipes]|nr:transposable element Tcb2 transposase [Trichonephila clavipes]